MEYVLISLVLLVAFAAWAMMKLKTSIDDWGVTIVMKLSELKLALDALNATATKTNATITAVDAAVKTLVANPADPVLPADTQTSFDALTSAVNTGATEAATLAADAGVTVS